MIKSYKECNEYEQTLLQQYKKVASLDELQKQLNLKMYGYGEGVLIYFKEGKVEGTIKIVLECLTYLKTVYIHYLEIGTEVPNKEEVAKKLIDAAICLGESRQADHILFGVRENEILTIVKHLGFEPSYHAYKMELTNRELLDKPLDLIALSDTNKTEYLSVFNQSFSDMPHGCYYEMEEIEEYLRDESQNEYYMVCDENQVIGFLNIEVVDEIGSMDLGLCPEYRGHGYGKRLLETAINRMNQLSLKHVTLTVIEKNERAMRMYEKRGFQINYVIGNWIVIK